MTRVPVILSGRVGDLFVYSFGGVFDRDRFLTIIRRYYRSYIMNITVQNSFIIFETFICRYGVFVLFLIFNEDNFGCIL